MRVAGDDDVDATVGRVAAERVDVVDDVEPDRADVGRHRFRNGRGPGGAVVVAAHRDDRRDRAERVEHRRGADVARVHDAVDAGERRERLGAQQAVGV